MSHLEAPTGSALHLLIGLVLSYNAGSAFIFCFCLEELYKFIGVKPFDFFSWLGRIKHGIGSALSSQCQLESAEKQIILNGKKRKGTL